VLPGDFSRQLKVNHDFGSCPGTRRAAQIHPLDFGRDVGARARWRNHFRAKSPGDFARHGRSASGGLLSPRIGYAINIGDSFGFWPRAGLTYVNYDGDEELGLTLEGQFFASPAAHFAFTFGPALDLGVVGDGREGKSIGVLTFGVLGWI